MNSTFSWNNFNRMECRIWIDGKEYGIGIRLDESKEMNAQLVNALHNTIFADIQERQII